MQYMLADQETGAHMHNLRKIHGGRLNVISRFICTDRINILYCLL